MGNTYIPRKKLEKDIEKGLLLSKNSTKCKICGHSVLLGRKDRKICSWCGNYIYKDDRTEFEYRLKEKVARLR